MIIAINVKDLENSFLQISDNTYNIQQTYKYISYVTSADIGFSSENYRILHRKWREGTTKWSRLGIRECFVFPFSQVYQIDGGRVVLSAQLSEHVTIDEDRLNQSGIDTLRLLSRSGSRVLHCGFVRDWKSISFPTYIFFVSHIYRRKPMYLEI